VRFEENMPMKLGKQTPTHDRSVGAAPLPAMRRIAGAAGLAYVAGVGIENMEVLKTPTPYGANTPWHMNMVSSPVPHEDESTRVEEEEESHEHHGRSRDYESRRRTGEEQRHHSHQDERKADAERRTSRPW
jgi:hypothetical protein